MSLPGTTAIETKGYLAAHKWLLLRRASQIAVLACFLAGPWAGLWLIKGNLTASRVLDVVPLNDPFVFLQSLAAQHWPDATAMIGVAIVVGFYALVGGRAYCGWVCPVNLVTDAAAAARRRLTRGYAWHPRRTTRLYILAGVLLAAAATGTLAFELINPVTIIHRGLVFGLGAGWGLLLAIFLFDAFIAARGWCGHLCPMGALYGLIGSVSQVRVRADNRADCNNCMDCFRICPEPHVIDLPLRGASQGASPVITGRDCTNCGRCIDVCSENVFRFGLRQHGAAAPIVQEGAKP